MEVVKCPLGTQAFGRSYEDDREGKLIEHWTPEPRFPSPISKSYDFLLFIIDCLHWVRPKDVGEEAWIPVW